MRNFINPRWIFLIHTLPVVFLLITLTAQLSVVESMIPGSSKLLFYRFAAVLGLITLGNILYGIYAIRKRIKLSILYGVVNLLVHISFLYVYALYYDNLIPVSIPRWMFSQEILIYVGTFLMPTMAHSLMVIILNVHNEYKADALWKNLIAGIAIPAGFYVFFNLLSPLWRGYESNAGRHFIIILFVLGTVLFIYFLVAALFIAFNNRFEQIKKLDIFLKILFVLLMPLLGLSVNQGFVNLTSFSKQTGIFGNFGSIWFFIMAIFNGVLLCLPAYSERSYRTALYIAKCFSYSFTLYFFIVFLPFLPFSLIAIIAAGLGFLMLTPVFVFVLHTQSLSADFKYLTAWNKKPLLYLAGVIAFAIIPTIILLHFQNQKRVLHTALEYLYSPDYDKEYNIETDKLKTILINVQQHKNRRNDIFVTGNQTPYLSSIYNRIVFNNLTLSDSKVDYIRNTLIGNDGTGEFTTVENLRNSDVKICDLKTECRYDAEKGAWFSTVHFEIENRSKGEWLAEYATNFTIPEGCWISDYYLYVGERKETGILTEKKTALWIFSQIRNENRDPGLLYYETPEKIVFRIFPFSKNEKRKTGIEFMHLNAVELNIDGKSIKLGESENITKINPHYAFISAADKQLLEPVNREPKYYFLIQSSVPYPNVKESFIEMADSFVLKHNLKPEDVEIGLINAYTRYYHYTGKWRDELRKNDESGGYHAEHAMRQTLVRHHLKTDPCYPVFICISDLLPQYRCIRSGLSDLSFAYPDYPYYADWRYNADSKIYSLKDNHAIDNDLSGELPQAIPVLAWPDSHSPKAYLRADNEAELAVLNYENLPEMASLQEKSADAALALTALSRAQVVKPNLGSKAWKNEVKYSFQSHIMSKATSFIVVETEAQKQVLMRKQQEVLNGEKMFDAGEEPMAMSEPALWILAGLFLAFLWWRDRKSMASSACKK